MAREKKWRVVFGGRPGEPRYMVITNGIYRTSPVFTMDGARILLQIVACVYALDELTKAAMGWSIAFSKLPASSTDR